jgi:transmembrane protein 231
VIRVPEQAHVYIPGFWETIKFAWMQYLSIFFIFWFLVHHLRSYVFRYQVVETTVMTDVAPKIKPF